jgi:ribosomal protein L40E
MADGTKDAVRDVAAAISEGISSPHKDRGVQVVRCHKCNEDNEASANYCMTCGASLGKSVVCAKCGELNDPDARFCDNCGQKVA